MKFFILFVVLLLLSKFASASTVVEKKCKAIKMCVFIMKGTDEAKKSRIKQTVERANDIWKQPCISFEADYKVIVPKAIMFPSRKDDDGNEIKVTLETLLVNGGLKIGKPLGKDSGEILDATGKGTGVTADDVLDALNKEAEKQCPKDSNGKRPLRAFPINGIDSASLSGLGYEGKDESGAITCDSGHFWNACADQAGTTLAHEIGHNLGLRHPKKGTPEDVEDNVAQEEPVSRKSSQCEYYTEKPSFTEAQEKCACAVIEKCYQFEQKPCPTTRWDKVRCDLEPIKEKYGPLLEKLNGEVNRLLDENEALLNERDECRKLLQPSKDALKKATTAFEKACTMVDEFVCTVQEELAEYKSLKDLKKRNKEERARFRELKAKYKDIVKDINENRKGKDKFPKGSEGIDKDEVAKTLAKNADGDDKDDEVYEKYRGLHDTKATAELNAEEAAKGLKEIEDKLKKIDEGLDKNSTERKEAIKKRNEAKSEMDMETGKVTEESGIEVY